MELFCPFLQVIRPAAEERQDDPGWIVFIGKSIGFVGIYVHGKRKVRAYAYDDIREDERTFIAFHDDKYLIIVLDVQLAGLDRCHMDVAFGDDDALFELKRTLRTDERTPGSALRVSGLSDYPGHAELPGVGHGDLHLCLAAVRPKHCYVFKTAFRALDGDSLIGHILPRLA